MSLHSLLVPKRTRLQDDRCRRIKVAVASFLKNKRLPLSFDVHFLHSLHGDLRSRAIEDAEVVRTRLIERLRAAV